MKTGLNNVLLPTLFTVVNNIEQYCYTWFRLNNIVQYCWQVWTTWAAKHCSILLSSGLGVFSFRVYFWKHVFPEIKISRDYSITSYTHYWKKRLYQNHTIATLTFPPSSCAMHVSFWKLLWGLGVITPSPCKFSCWFVCNVDVARSERSSCHFPRRV
jgi:hypothetical protein